MLISFKLIEQGNALHIMSFSLSLINFIIYPGHVDEDLLPYFLRQHLPFFAGACMVVLAWTPAEEGEEEHDYQHNETETCTKHQRH